MIVQLLRLCAKWNAVDRRESCAFDVCDEKPGRPPRDDGNLHAGFADGGQILGQIQRTPGSGTRKHLNRGVARRTIGVVRWGGRSNMRCRRRRCCNRGSGRCWRRSRRCGTRHRHWLHIGLRVRRRSRGGRHRRWLADDHRFFEVSRRRRDRRVVEVLQLMLADLDHIVVLKKMFLDRFAVDQRTVGGIQVLDE